MSNSRLPLIVGLALAFILAGSVIIATGMGYIPAPASDVIRVVAARLGVGQTADIDRILATVIIDVRLPRIFAAVLVGGVLAVSGTVFQAILLNPLADPYTLGISSGAAFGASLSLVLSLTGLGLGSHFLTVPLFAFIGSIATLAVVLYLASVDSRLSSSSLILAGVIVAAILSAAIGFLKFLADEQVGVIIFWLMGSLAGCSWQDVEVITITAGAGLLVAIYFSRDLNIMAMGRRSADTMGVDTVRVRKILLIVCSLMTAVCVAVTGIIGFVGLIVPHLLRFTIGPDNRFLTPLSFLGGGLLLLSADTVTRAVLPVEIPIGVLTALLGGPFFCFIFRRKLKERQDLV